jgi:membrane protease YdiL (CAAX protease family)
MSTGDIPDPSATPPPPPPEAMMLPATGISQVPLGPGPGWRPPRRPGPSFRHGFVTPGPNPGFGTAFLFFCLNFLLALAWCFLFLMVTQVPPAIFGILVYLVGVAVRPDLRPPQDMELHKVMFETPLGKFSMSVTMAGAEVLVVFVSWLAIRLLIGRDWPRRLALRAPSWTHLVLVLLAVPGMVLLANGLYYVLRYIWHLPSLSDIPNVKGMEEMVAIFNSWPALFAVLVIGVGPGIGEELWCRGFLGNGLVARYRWLGVVLTAFFFGLIHVDPCQGIMAMLMGLWLHFTYLMTRSLLVPILLHFINNSLAVISSRVEALNRVEAGIEDFPVYIFAAAAFLLLAIGYALYRSRPRLEGDLGGPPLWRPEAPGVEWPPPRSGTRVVHPWPPLDAILVAGAGCVAALVAWLTPLLPSSR